MSTLEIIGSFASDGALAPCIFTQNINITCLNIWIIEQFWWGHMHNAEYLMVIC
jgi:hypothetical protein